DRWCYTGTRAHFTYCLGTGDELGTKTILANVTVLLATRGFAVAGDRNLFSSCPGVVRYWCPDHQFPGRRQNRPGSSDREFVSSTTREGVPSSRNRTIG